MYELENIGFAYGPKTIIADLSLTFETGHFYGIIGPNGSGKTTLIDLLAGHIRPHCGTITLNGRSLEHCSRKFLARRIALVPQDFRINFPYTCGEIVMMGRYPHIPRFARPGDQDRAVVKTVLQQTGLGDFVHRYVTQLSGGERQRVVFARGLAQDTPVLLLDEATSNLDLRHTIALLNLAAERVSRGATVVAVMQDVNLAAMYCNRLVCLRNGTVFAAGSVDTVLTTEVLKAVFHVNTRVTPNEFSGSRQVVFNRDVN
jgi:iron complex transport system ATP-binding protein